MLLVLGKNTLEINKFTKNVCLPNFELKFKLLENLRKPLTLKSMRKGFHCLPTLKTISCYAARATTNMFLTDALDRQSLTLYFQNFI